MEERNHPATDRQRQRFRERGQVAQSRDLSAVGALAGGTLALGLLGATSARAVTEFLGQIYGRLGTVPPEAIGRPLVAAAVTSAGPSLLGAAAGALLVGMLQNQGRLSSKAIELDLSRLNPLTRLKEMFASIDGAIALGVSLTKVSVVGAVCVATLMRELPPLLAAEPTSLRSALIDGGEVLVTLVVRAAVAMLALGLGDWGLTWFRLEQKMRMTTQEVRDDMKEELGDPLVRAQRRRRQRELARQRSLREVPRATLVLVNPTHYAVALRYTANQMSAPKVVARGAGLAADRIRAMARHSGIPVLSNPPLTRLLYRRVRVGAEIPADLYQAVAVMLAYVFKLRARMA